MLEKFRNNRREIIFSAVFSFCFTACALCGMALDRLGTVWVNYNWAVGLFIFATAFFAFFMLLELLPKLDKGLRFTNKYLESRFFQPTWTSFAYCFGFIALCHLPAFLAYFPGVFTYDVLAQAQFFADKDYLEIHPILHNLMVYGALLINQKFNSGIIGILIYTVFQVATTLAVFSYTIKVLSKYKTPFLLKLGALLFFALYPTNQVFPLIATKDILFSVFVLLEVVLLTELSIDKTAFLNSKIKCGWLALGALLMFLFRHNGLHAYILTLPFLLFFYIKACKLNYKKLLVIFLLPLVLYGVVTVIKRACGIKPAPLASSLGIPIQQLGRVRLVHDKTLSEEEKELYRQIIPPQNEFAYFPLCVDNLKLDGFTLHSDYIENSLRTHPEYFTHLYTKWARLYPYTYVDAFLLTNYGYWHPFVKFKRLGLHLYLLTYNRWNPIVGIPVHSYGMIPQLRAFHDKIFLNNRFDNNFFTRLLFSISLNTWYFITALFILAYKRRYDLIVPLLLPLGLLVSVLFGPIVLLRYVYQNFLILPLLAAFCVTPNFSSSKE